MSSQIPCFVFSFLGSAPRFCERGPWKSMEISLHEVTRFWAERGLWSGYLVGLRNCSRLGNNDRRFYDHHPDLIRPDTVQEFQDVSFNVRFLRMFLRKFFFPCHASLTLVIVQTGYRQTYRTFIHSNFSGEIGVWQGEGNVLYDVVGRKRKRNREAHSIQD